MGSVFELQSSDGFSLSAYRAEPSEEPRGGVVVVQEIFGVNSHIRSVCDDYAAEGYLAIAPALFDRTERDIELAYEGPGVARGALIARGLDRKNTLRDIQAAIDTAAISGKVGVVGYCFGGTMAWLAAAECSGLRAASCYYGGNIVQLLERKPRVPVILHFAEHDKGIPLENVEKIRAAYPELPIHLYDAGHGFNCSARSAHDAPAAKLAKERTLALFRQYVG